MRKEFLPYIKLVEFLGKVMGSHTEVVLHDMTDPNNSIIAIVNGHVSGRKVGGPATDLVLKIINDHPAHPQNYLCNYMAFGEDGRRLRSSTFFIHDKNDKIIGMLCINMDCQALLDALDILKSLTTFEPSDPTGDKTEAISENLATSAEKLTLQSIREAVHASGCPPDKMTQPDKIRVVKKLYGSGIFLLKGSVTRTAQFLKISEPSVYRYLKLIKQENRQPD